MTSPFTAAALQFPIDMGGVAANAERAFRNLEAAARAGAAFCLLPEMWSTGFHYEELAALSRTTPGLLDRVRTFAARSRTVVTGSLPERVGRSVYNTMFVVDSDGSVAGEYRKAHLFSPSGEHNGFRRGTKASPVPTSAGVVGPLICYDLRFPELARKYFLEGATILAVSAQWPQVRAAHWNVLCAARAVENQMYLVATNAVGTSGPFRFAGGALIVSPSGEILASRGDEEGIATATLDPSKVEEFRGRIPCRLDRNPRAYRPTRPPR